MNPAKTEVHNSEIVYEFLKEMQSAGYDLEGAPIADGKIHRFPHEDRNGGRAGWYVLYADGLSSGSFGDWRSDQSFNWCAKKETEFTTEERSAFRQRIEEQKRARQAEEDKTRAEAAEKARQLWKSAKPADSNHPYFIEKQVKPYDLRQDDAGRLVVPVRDESGS